MDANECIREREMKRHIARVLNNKDYEPNRRRNFRMELNLYAGAVIGVVAPIVAARYTLFNDNFLGRPMDELVVWSCAVAVNCIPLGAFPLMFYSLICGGALGGASKEQLEKIYSKKDRKRNATENQEQYLNDRLSDDLITNVSGLN